LISVPSEWKDPCHQGILQSQPLDFDKLQIHLEDRTMSDYLGGKPIDPPPITGDLHITELVDHYFNAYNGARLREACHLFASRMLEDDVTVGMSVSGALTPAGVGMSSLIPLIEAGYIDWLVSTGANLYHDTHFGIGLSLHQGRTQVSDVDLRKEGVVRIFDIFFDYQVLLSTDRFYREIIVASEFQRSMSTAEFHHLVGKYLDQREQVLGIGAKSILASAYRNNVPVYTSSPGDSSIGMNIAARALDGNRLTIDISKDVNETAAIVLGAKRGNGKSAVVILGGGSPKNFVLQTEPQIQEVLGIGEKGHDYFLQITDARPDTGGLSGATPSEAVSWGKVDPSKLPDAVVCYVDCTIATPILASYALASGRKREKKGLYQRLPELMDRLRKEYAESSRDR
jgi:deoxyhypusine synthase